MPERTQCRTCVAVKELPHAHGRRGRVYRPLVGTDVFPSLSIKRHEIDRG